MSPQTRRVIFNKSRGCMMAVSELASSTDRLRKSCTKRCQYRALPVSSPQKPNSVPFYPSNKPLDQSIWAQAATNLVAIICVFFTMVGYANASQRATSITAGNNVSIIATGAPTGPSSNSNVLVQGSTITAGNNALLAADNTITLQAANNQASQTSSNSSSSASVGVSYSLVTGAVGFNASASKGQGSGNGQGTSATNSQITAGNTATLQSGGNTTLAGAVVAAGRIKADVGGNLSIQSRQDISSYTSQQSNAGGSVSFGGGGVTGGSISTGKSNINSNFNSVNEQSGLKAGDGGFTVNVQGNTDLKGAVISSTQAAVDAAKNSFTTGGQTSITDLQNTASYKGTGASIGVSVGTGKDKNQQDIVIPGGSIGFGSAKGDATSTASAGITGIAGNTAVRTGDTNTGLTALFDAAKVQRDINAQVQITAGFGQQASKAIGDYAQTQTKLADAKTLQAAKETDPAKKAALEQEAKTLDDNWGDNGKLRLLAHTAVGGLTGGLGGAAGAAAGTLAAPAVASALANAGITGGLASTITALASTAAGAIAGGGVTGAATAFNEVTNNYLSHVQWRKLAKDLETCKAKNTCDTVAAEARQLNAANDARLADACKVTTSAGCVVLATEAKAARDDQIALGIDSRVLGANANGVSDLIVGKVLSAQNLAASRQYCADNPQACVTELQGATQLAIGVVKGVPNTLSSLVNTPSTVLDGYVNMYQAATGQTLMQLPKVPNVVDCASGLQSAGCVAGEVVGGVLLGSAVTTGVRVVGTARVAAAEASAQEAAIAGARIENNGRNGIVAITSDVAPTTRGIAQFGPMSEPGPLPLPIANTFRSGTYAETVTTEPTVLYGAYGGTANQMGGYWTTTRPAGPIQSIVDSALNPAWGNPATSVVRIEVPPGVTLYQGQAAAQGGLVGGGNQVLFHKNVTINPAWIKP